MKKLNLKLSSRITFLSSITYYRLLITVLTFLCLCTSFAKSDTHYVSKKGSDTFPYTTLETAARIIQDAVNSATDGDTVLVNDGTYKTGGAVAPGQTLMNRVMITNSIILKSVNGPKKTRIAGKKDAGNNNIRGIFLGTNAQLIGFTIINGGTEKFETGSAGKNPKYDGGGVFAVYENIISNCTICFNKCDHFGAGIYAENADILSCLIKNNRSLYSGGGISCLNSIISNCYIKNNNAIDFYWLDGPMNNGYGGGIDSGGSIIKDTIIERNKCGASGGGIWGTDLIIVNCKIIKNRVGVRYSEGASGGGVAASFTMISNCYIYKNIAVSICWTDGGGIIGGNVYNSIITKNKSLGGACYAGTKGGGAFHANLFNCLIADNRIGGGKNIIIGGGLYGCNAVNCTIVGNKALGRKASNGGVANSTVTNSIVYFNTARTLPNYGTNSFFAYSCSYPKPNGEGNIDSVPLFVNIKKQDFHLQQNSPCINTGTNMDWMVGVVDLDNKPRITGSTVDIGAFENQ